MYKTHKIKNFVAQCYKNSSWPITLSPVILYLYARLLALDITLKYAVICHGGLCWLVVSGEDGRSRSASHPASLRDAAGDSGVEGCRYSYAQKQPGECVVGGCPRRRSRPFTVTMNSMLKWTATCGSPAVSAYSRALRAAASRHLAPSFDLAAYR